MSALTSRDNPKVKRWAKLAADARYRRSEKRALIEGPHLLAAVLKYGCKPVAVLATDEGAADAEIAALIRATSVKPVLLARGVFRSVVDAETPQGVAAEIAIPQTRDQGNGPAVFLEGVQDPSNVGAILRSAAAFGVKRVVMDSACADAWSPKALRAGMGGHFALTLHPAADLSAELNAFKGSLLSTVPHGGMPLEEANLTGPVGWLFGGEGRGLSEEALCKVPLRVTIPMAEGSESLNVAAAAAICLYETFSRSGAGS
ncbi:MAG TPA: RNA methyltransferase [Burkholderiales bacterium]|nr:RNA methyltransferase [Burkholderiales bacterium]